MKYAILSDVHSNLEALKSVLEDISREKVDKAFFLGDVVGYGASPEQCIDLIQECTAVMVAGNHDWAAVGLTDCSDFNPVAKAAIEWTAGEITPTHQDFLKKLPLFHTHHNFILVHATLYQPEKWHYVFSSDEASRALRQCDRQICFIGHSHTPAIFEQDEAGKISLLSQATSALHHSHRYIINVGSVGQPRDGDPRAAYGIYSPEDAHYTLRKVPYNIGNAQRKIVEAGLPPFLASRLGSGT